MENKKPNKRSLGTVDLELRINGLDDLERLAGILNERLEAARETIDQIQEIVLSIDIQKKATDDTQSRNLDSGQD